MSAGANGTKVSFFKGFRSLNSGYSEAGGVDVGFSERIEAFLVFEKLRTVVEPAIRKGERFLKDMIIDADINNPDYLNNE